MNTPGAEELLEQSKSLVQETPAVSNQSTTARYAFSKNQDDSEPHVERLAGVSQMDLRDYVLMGLIAALGILAAVALIADWSRFILAVCALAAAGIAMSLAIGQFRIRPDHVRAQESDRITRTANEALPFMMEGLDTDNAQEVCEIVLAASPSAVAVAITDDQQVLGFAGKGADHHTPGRPIVTKATRAAIERNETIILTSKVAIGCRDPRCPLRAAIVVPLGVGSRAIGTLKYYYNRESDLTETELVSAEGLARLLSTQLVIAELENQENLATELELKALQAQINPHFLFNTINTIGSFIRTDADKARHLLRHFAGFYRRTLEHGDQPITLGLELEFLKQYFELEKARFGDQVNLSLDIDPDALDLPMPPFMLQPLAENSIEHGMRDDGSALQVSVVVKAAGDANTFHAAISDNGVGISATALPTIMEKGSGTGLGVALKNVSDRLRGFYGLETGLVIESEKGTGTVVSFLMNDPAKN